MRYAIIGTILAAFLHAAVAHAQSASVVQGGKEWLQPKDFPDNTWNEVEAVCPEASAFKCDGELNGIDVTGFTWASVDDLNALFNSYGVEPPLGPGPEFLVGPVDSGWAPRFISDFPDTGVELVDCYYTWGWARTTTSSNGRAPYIEDCTTGFWQGYGPADFADTAHTRSIINSYSEGTLGVWLYRAAPYVAVPTLSAYGIVLIVLGLFALGAWRLSGRQGKAV